jgi:hypothetical protein
VNGGDAPLLAEYFVPVGSAGIRGNDVLMYAGLQVTMYLRTDWIPPRRDTVGISMLRARVRAFQTTEKMKLTGNSGNLG